MSSRRRRADDAPAAAVESGQGARSTAQIVETGTTTPGVTATLVTDDADMTISYATTAVPGSRQHTGTEVRVAATGPQAADVLGFTT